MNSILITEEEFKNIDFTVDQLEIGEYDDCTFINCNFSNTDLTSFTFTECAFKSCDFSMAKIQIHLLRILNL